MSIKRATAVVDEAANSAPVLRGRWELCGYALDPERDAVRCSACGFALDAEQKKDEAPPYCPNCGASNIEEDESV